MQNDDCNCCHFEYVWFPSDNNPKILWLVLWIFLLEPFVELIDMELYFAHGLTSLSPVVYDAVVLLFWLVLPYPRIHLTVLQFEFINKPGLYSAIRSITSMMACKLSKRFLISSAYCVFSEACWISALAAGFHRRWRLPWMFPLYH
jgi:hypothetical protein